MAVTLQDIAPGRMKALRAAEPLCVEAAASVFSLEPRVLRLRTRRQPIAAARQLAMALMRDQYGFTFAEIAWAMRMRDHGTVSYACSTVWRWVQTQDRHLCPKVGAALRTLRALRRCAEQEKDLEVCHG